MSDTLYSGHRYGVLNVIDEGVREALNITVGTSLSSNRVVRVLEGIVAEQGKLKRIRVDNGPEMTSSTFTQWCEEKEIESVYIHQHRTRTSNVSTARLEPRYWMPIYFIR
jgi:putative transposase